MHPWLYMQHNSNTERVRCLHKAKITCSPWLFIKPMQSVLKRLKAEVIPFISSLLVAAKVCWWTQRLKYIFCIIHQNPSNQRHTWESIIYLNPLIIKSQIRECLILFMPHTSNISKFKGIFTKNKRYLIIFNVQFDLMNEINYCAWTKVHWKGFQGVPMHTFLKSKVHP